MSLRCEIAVACAWQLPKQWCAALQKQFSINGRRYDRALHVPGASTAASLSTSFARSLGAGRRACRPYVLHQTARLGTFALPTKKDKLVLMQWSDQVFCVSVVRLCVYASITTIVVGSSGERPCNSRSSFSAKPCAMTDPSRYCLIYPPPTEEV